MIKIKDHKILNKKEINTRFGIDMDQYPGIDLIEIIWEEPFNLNFRHTDLFWFEKDIVKKKAFWGDYENIVEDKSKEVIFMWGADSDEYDDTEKLSVTDYKNTMSCHIFINKEKSYVFYVSTENYIDSIERILETEVDPKKVCSDLIPLSKAK